MPQTFLFCLQCNSIGMGFFGFLCFMLGWILRTWLVGKLCELQASCSPHVRHICLTLSLCGFFNCFPLGAGDIMYMFSDTEKLPGKSSLVNLFLWTSCTLKTCRTSVCRGVFTHAIDTRYEVSPICASA